MVTMTDHQTAHWIKSHMKQFATHDGGKLAVFSINGKTIEVPIPGDLWRHCLQDHNSMAELRRSVMDRALRERRYEQAGD